MKGMLNGEDHLHLHKEGQSIGTAGYCGNSEQYSGMVSTHRCMAYKYDVYLGDI